MTCHIQEWQLPFLLLALSPFVLSDSDYLLILCPLCKSKTLWNIFMILGRNVEQDQMTCRVQEWQLCLSFCWSFLPLLCLTDFPWISYPLCKSKTSVAHLDHRPTGDQEVAGSTPTEVGNILEIDHEIFSTVIPSLQLIQKGQLSVSGERMCTVLVNRLED